MKTQKEKKDNSESLKNNPMASGGKSPKPKKTDNADPEEFEEDRSMKLRMKKQPLKITKNTK